MVAIMFELDFQKNIVKLVYIKDITRDKREVV